MKRTKKEIPYKGQGTDRGYFFSYRRNSLGRTYNEHLPRYFEQVLDDIDQVFFFKCEETPEPFDLKYREQIPYNDIPEFLQSAFKSANLFDLPALSALYKKQDQLTDEDNKYFSYYLDEFNEEELFVVIWKKSTPDWLALDPGVVRFLYMLFTCDLYK